MIVQEEMSKMFRQSQQFRSSSSFYIALSLHLPPTPLFPPLLQPYTFLDTELETCPAAHFLITTGIFVPLSALTSPPKEEMIVREVSPKEMNLGDPTCSGGDGGGTPNPYLSSIDCRERLPPPGFQESAFLGRALFMSPSSALAT